MPQTFHQTTLNNGLTIIAEADTDAASSAAGFFVKTGARDELSKVMGVSHFLEHMMFKGTTDICADELNRAFDEIGARNNAYTSSEMTCFYAHTLPEHLPRGLELLGRMMRPALRQADFDTEKGVILEEIAMYKDNPFWVLYEASVETHYGPHPMSHRVLGTDQTITDLKRDEMQEYFDFRYSADNPVVALAGKLDFDAAVKQIQQLCGNWQRTGAKREGLVPKPVGGELRLTSDKVSRGYLLYLCPGPSVSDERRYAAALLAQVLGASDNSRLHWSLVETGLAEEAQAAYDGHDGIGDYYVYASGDPERLDEIATAIDKELDGLIDSITDDDLERLRNKIATGAALGGERPGDRMQRLGRVWTTLGKRIPLEEEVDRINRVTLDEIRKMYVDFPIRPITRGRLVPA